MDIIAEQYRTEIAERLKDIFERIEESCQRAGCNSQEITLVAVSKRQPEEKIQIVFELLQETGRKFTFGESFVQEYVAKQEVFAGAEIHYIGSLQRNKIRKAVQLFDCIQSVGSLRVLAEIAKEAEKQKKKQRVLLQVNVSGDSEKSGFLVEDLQGRLDDISVFGEELQIEGLMTITRYYENPEDVRSDFQRMKLLKEEMQESGILPEKSQLSMGMSRDFDIALEEGSTMIRIGTDIFGVRE